VRSIVLPLLALSILAACGGSPPANPNNPTTKESDATPPSTAPTGGTTSSSPPAPEGPPGMPKTVAVDLIFGKVKGDLFACYEQGKKAAPKMTGGKITLHAEVEKDGTTSCVIPADDTGLTQEVEDCMRLRLNKETFASSPAPWSYEMPLVVKNGKLELGEDDAVTAVASILHVEMHGLGDDAHDVAEALLPKFQQCVIGAEKGETMRVLHVGARVGKDGKVMCAIATSPSPLPEEIRACAAGALEQAKFPPPKKGEGLISIPLKVMARKKK
jgi:hypothetical protein